MRPPRAVRAVLSLLIKTFPWEFRDAFGDGMLDVMYTGYRVARTRGRPRAVAFLVAAASDLVTAGVEERLRPTWKRSPIESTRKRELGMMVEQLTKDFMYAARSLIRAPATPNASWVSGV